MACALGPGAGNGINVCSYAALVLGGTSVLWEGREGGGWWLGEYIWIHCLSRAGGAGLGVVRFWCGLRL